MQDTYFFLGFHVDSQHNMCSSSVMAKTRERAGKTETFSVSVDAETKGLLRDAAARWHEGNMSRLFTAVAHRLAEEAAFERAWTWYGGSLPTERETAEVDAWIDRVTKKKRTRRGVAA